MMATRTLKVIPSYNQNFNHNIIPFTTKVINYNVNNYKNLSAYNSQNGFFKENAVLTPTVTLSQASKPAYNREIFSYSQYDSQTSTSVPRYHTSQNGINYDFSSIITTNSAPIEISSTTYRNRYPYNNLLRGQDYSNGYDNNYLVNNIYTTYSQKNLHSFNSSFNLYIEPDFNIKLNEFIILNQIGQGSEGLVYKVRWIKNNKTYAMKKCGIQSLEAVKTKDQEIVTVKNFVESTGNDGILKTFGRLCKPNSIGFFDYYEIMEFADRDWEQEIMRRQKLHLFYQEYELTEILGKLVRNFSSLQTNHITHRDVKPQNIMLLNGIFKISDFGNAKILKREGIIIQRVRGSELFMSPIVFKGYHSGVLQIQHNSYKSDVFSLGMCLFFAACLSYDGPSCIREVYDMNTIRRVLNQYLGRRYSQNFINILFTMLQVEERKRPDFNQLEIMFSF